MARPLRVEIPGGLYHITARGNGRRWIVRDDVDRGIFFEIVEQVVDRFGIVVHAACLMDNHHHLLIETPRPNLARAMRQLNGVYAQTFNRRHKRWGHLFGDRYKAILVDRDNYFLALARYIVLNPCRAHICTQPDAFRWSSYRATAGYADIPAWLNVHTTRAYFGTGAQAIERYRAFVCAGLDDRPLDHVRGQIYLGDKSFAQHHADRHASTEIPFIQRLPEPPPLSEIFQLFGDEAIALAYREFGYTLAEIAHHQHVHYATISRRLRALEQAA